MPAVSPSLTTFLFEAANFAALAAVLGWLFFNPVRDALRRHRELLKQQSEEAERKLREAEASRQAIEARRAQLDEEFETLRNEAREAAGEEARKLLDDARQRIARQRESSRREAAMLEEAEATRLAEAIARAVKDLLDRLLDQVRGPELHGALVRAACRQLAESQEAFRDVLVESAESLDAEALRDIAESMRLAPDVLEKRINPELLAGVRVHSNRGLVDASVAGLTEFARRRLSAHLKEVAEESRIHG